ncbi:MAG: cyclic lactone autoinducer peptide [Bacilli bacterium]|nr:cyclic lactone autoinducer peptide [Bacilli bacterium]
MEFLANALASIGSFFAGIGSQACILVWWDEPECPKSLIK